MKIKASLFVIALSGIAASCGAVPSDLPSTAPALTEMGVDGAAMRPAPAGETAANADQRFARLRRLDAASIPVRGAIAIEPGRYVGNLELKEHRYKELRQALEGHELTVQVGIDFGSAIAGVIGHMRSGTCGVCGVNSVVSACSCE